MRALADRQLEGVPEARRGAEPDLERDSLDEMAGRLEQILCTPDSGVA
jgi:hypothetical protein